MQPELKAAIVQDAADDRVLMLAWMDAEAERRISGVHKPYHHALRALVARTRQQFGFCILLDCHSMPSVGGPLDRDHGQARVDFVLGDCFGTSCAPSVTDIADRSLSGFGYLVTRNDPYAGGFTTRHYGRPGEGLPNDFSQQWRRRLDCRRCPSYAPFTTVADKLARAGPSATRWPFSASPQAKSKAEKRDAPNRKG